MAAVPGGVQRRVRFAETWGDEWTVVPGAFPVAFDNGTLAAPGSARVVLRSAGMVLEPGETTFTQRGWTDLVGWYCWIEERKPDDSWRHCWLGYVSEQTQAPERADVAQGRQEVVCESILRLLDRMPVATSWWRRGGANVEVDLYPEFNRLNRRDGSLRGNRRSVPEDGAGYSGESYVFVGDDAEAPSVWDNFNIAQTMLDFHVPDSGPAWALAGQTSALGAIRQAWSAGQQSVGDWLRRLMAPTSGIDAWDDYDGGDTVTLNVFTLYGGDVDVGGVTIPANADVADYPLADDADFPENQRMLAAPVVRTLCNASYARIVCRTAMPILAVGEWVVGADLVPMWPAALQADYMDPPGVAGVQEKDDHRRQEKYRGVFENYVHLGTFEGLRPKAADDGSVTLDDAEGAWLKGGGLSFESWTPFEDDVDYSTDPPGRNDLPDDMVESERPPQYRPMHAYVNVPRGAADVWRQAERLSETETGLHSFRPYALPHRMGVALHSSYAQHFGSTAVTGFKSMKPGLIDYADNVSVVAAFRTPERQRFVVEMEAPAGAVADIAPDLVFDVPGTDCWIAVAGVTVGVADDGTTKHLAAGAELLRDDADALKSAAAVLKAWYGNPRREMSATVAEKPSNDADPMLPAVGSYVRDLTDGEGGTVAINAVVSRHEHRLEKHAAGWRWVCELKCGYGGGDMGRAMAAEFAGRRQRRLR